MSKLRRFIFRAVSAFASILLGTLGCFAAPPEIVIRVVDAAAGEIRVAGTAESVRGPDFHFLRSYAGFEIPGGRIGGLVLRAENGNEVSQIVPRPAEFRADGNFRYWEYGMKLTVPSDPRAMAHHSWLNGEVGLVMPADILPEGLRGPVTMRFVLPDGWSVHTGERVLAPGTFEVPVPDDAVFMLSGSARTIGGAGPGTAIFGEWQFSDDEAAGIARSIYGEYLKMFRSEPVARPQVLLIRFPDDVPRGRWEAETRGRTVTILSAEMPFKTQAVQRLHEQLRHELFHLWIPNGLDLSGSYDWFYEGSALYQSLRTAVALNRIRFDDFLDTIGRAYDIDSINTRRMTLIEASQKRWAGANAQVYARGMLVAFLADLALLEKSGGRRSLTDLLREVVRRHRKPAPRVDGNAAVIAVLESRPEVKPIVDKYIRGADDIDWSGLLKATGISVSGSSNSKLSVGTGLSGRQKELLDKLGYNNWRRTP